MRTSVIFTTYNEPRALELVLWGFAAQDRPADEILVADDGSGPETAALIERMRADTGLPLVHVWHADQGFRKTEILDRAILRSTGDYLLFTDGDCIPRRDWVHVHARLAEPGRFISGGYLKLPAEVSEAITPDVVRRGLHADLSWLRRAGWRPGRHALRLLRNQRAAAMLDAVTPTGATWNGHNASGWRTDLFRVNGYDMEMAYGGLDRAVGECLENAGIRGRQVRFRAPVIHLHHARPYLDPEKVRRNREHRARIRRAGITRAARGLAELASDTPDKGQS